MVKLTAAQEQYIKNRWEKLDKKAVTARALVRVFTVYPWTTRLFKSFKNLHDPCDPGVQAHADKVQLALSKGVANLKEIMSTYSKLSRDHQTIGVDTGSFKLLGQTFIVEVAMLDKEAFGPKEHEAAYKFFTLVAEALSSNYR